MPDCSSCSGGTFQFAYGPLTFNWASLRFRPAAEAVRGYAAAVDAHWTQADLDRFAAKVQAFNDSLTADEQVVFDAIVRGSG